MNKLRRRRQPITTATQCMECGATGVPAAAYHPFLYCELVKLGHHDPESYLRSYGFVRALPDAVSSDGR